MKTKMWLNGFHQSDTYFFLEGACDIGIVKMYNFWYCKTADQQPIYAFKGAGRGRGVRGRFSLFDSF